MKLSYSESIVVDRLVHFVELFSKHCFIGYPNLLFMMYRNANAQLFVCVFHSVEAE
jgi:hypothetical protein